MKYKSIDMRAKQSQALVIHCADPRFQSAYRKVIDGLGDYYDLLVVPGASKGILDDPAMIKNIKLLETFHHFKKIYILDHIECGAFGPVADEVEAHHRTLTQTTDKIKQAMPKQKVYGYLLNAKAAKLIE